jgi:hypothetical protein
MEIRQHHRRRHNPLLEQLGNHASLELNPIVLTEEKLALADALKQSSTLKSLNAIADIEDDNREDSASLSSVIANALKVTSSLAPLDL